jgi:hypothetical protein
MKPMKTRHAPKHHGKHGAPPAGRQQQMAEFRRPPGSARADLSGAATLE